MKVGEIMERRWKKRCEEMDREIKKKEREIKDLKLGKAMGRGKKIPEC